MPKKKDEIDPIDASFDDVADSVLRKKTIEDNSRREIIKDGGSLQVQGVEIHVIGKGEEDYISLTDMAGGFDGEGDTSHIEAWLRSKNTIDFLGVWEKINNPDSNSVEFDGIRMEAGTNRFKMSAKQWAQKTNGIGLIARTGRYGGTFAHKDIAFEFGSWLSPEFKLYLIKEFQVLKERESKSEHLEWNIRRGSRLAERLIKSDELP